MTVDPFDDRVCNCGKTGCLELYASATGIVYETKKALKDYKEATTLRDLDEVTAKDIFDAAKEGDTFAKERVDDLGQKLALAAGNIALMVDPEVFVIGGGVSRAGQILLDAVIAHFKKYTFGKAQETGFVPVSYTHLDVYKRQRLGKWKLHKRMERKLYSSCAGGTK